MGRYDDGTNLYYQGDVYGSYRRAFWHPGIGAWQLDDGGLGTSMSYGRFDTYYSSNQVADVMSSRYCGSGGDLSYVFAPWVACGSNGSNCSQITLPKIYDQPSDSLMDMSRDYSVGRYGGSDARTCRFEGEIATFTCYYVNYANAQGYTGSWVFNINGTPPLALPYYVFKQVVGGVSYEWRYWMSNDTGFGFNIVGRRTYGANSRNGLTWSNVGLCDVTASRGSCGGAASIQVNSPNGGEIWTVGSSYSITWSSANLNSAGGISIYYWYNNDWQLIAGPLATTATSYLWTIPNTPTTSSWVWIGNGVNNVWEAYDQSDQSFSITSPPDTTPPTPNPMTWSTQPYAASSTSISMVATTATDSQSPPVSYYFDFVSSPTGGSGGSDLGWQSSTSYTNSGLQPNHQYGYQVRARDSAPTSNWTSYSSPIIYKYTFSNAPGTSLFSNVTQISIQANWTANGNRSSTEYWCENTTKGTNSNWTTNLYWNETGLTCGISYSYRVKARNGDGLETGWTSLGSQPTSACSETVSTPSTPSGQTSGTTGTSYSYTTGGSTSNLVGHSVQYQFDWKGDGTDLSSWGSATQSKTWSTAGIYYVRARARCTTHTPVVSGWSGILTVNISSTSKPVVTITATVPTASEANLSTGTFTISRTGSTTSLLTVYFSVGGSATPGNDYVALPSAVTIGPGMTTADVAVIPLDDSIPEGDETVTVKLEAPGGTDYVIGTPSSATVTIADNDQTQYTLNVNINPSGGGSVAGSGINCPGTCSGSYNSGTSVPLTANANSGYQFSSWSNCDSPQNNTCTMNMTSNKTVTANFTQNCPIPGTPSNPYPSNGATNIPVNLTLNWSGTNNTDSYDVYFGTSSNPPYIGNTQSPGYQRSGLSNNTTYYWKIVSKNNCGNSTSGSVWSFTTASSGGGATLTVISPNGGENWLVGTNQLITWSSSNLNPNGSIYIFYWYNNDWYQIAVPLPPSSTSYSWTIPNTPTSSTKIRIGNWIDSAWEASDQSDQSFAINSPSDTTPPTIQITSPTSNPTYSTSSSPLTVGGWSASDNVGVTQVTWVNDRGGSGTCSGTTSWSCSGITLYSGDNIITVTAKDAANNHGTDTLTVTYTPTLNSRIGVFRNGSWYLDLNDSGSWNGCTTDLCFNFGLSTDTPIAGDWNGDGWHELGVKRGSNWYLDYNGNGIWDGCVIDRCYTFGLSTDIPVAGDWNNSGTDKIGVFRNGAWYLDFNGNGIWNGCLTDLCISFGLSTDIPVVGDWNGDGYTEIGVFRNGMWYLDYDRSDSWGGCGVDKCYTFGLSTDAPIVGDWSGSGYSKIGVKRGVSWYLDYSGEGSWSGCITDRCYTFGLSTDKPVAGDW
jgi:hypothetical protein